MDLDTHDADNDSNLPRPVHPHRRDGLVSLLSQPQQTLRGETNNSTGFLIRLLKSPPSVAVPQERLRAGDIRDTKRQRLEREATVGQGLLPDARLTPKVAVTASSEASSTENTEYAYFTKDLWGEYDKQGQDQTEGGAQQGGNEFPPIPTGSYAEEPDKPTGPWWKELLASPVKRLRLSTWGRNFKDFALPKLELPPPLDSSKSPEVQADSSQCSGHQKRRKDLPKRCTAAGMSKPSRRNALKLAKAKGALANVIARVEDDYYANSSKAAKSSKKNTVAGATHCKAMMIPLFTKKKEFCPWDKIRQFPCQ